MLGEPIYSYQYMLILLLHQLEVLNAILTLLQIQQLKLYLQIYLDQSLVNLVYLIEDIKKLTLPF